MSLFRSETIIHKKLRIPSENSLEIMSKLGSLHDYIEFEDLNQNLIDTQKPYYNMIQRCDENEKQLKFLDEIISNIFNNKYERYQNYDFFKAHLDQDMRFKEKKYTSDYFDLLEIELNDDVQKIKEQIKLNNETIDDYLFLLEFKFALDKLISLFNTDEINFDDLKVTSELKLDTDDDFSDIEMIEDKNMNFKRSKERRKSTNSNLQNINYMIGMCKFHDELKISRMIFRASKDRAIPSFFDIDISNIKNERVKKHLSEKRLFLVFIQGNYLPNKIKKILGIYNCSIFEMPHGTKFTDEIEKIKKELSEKEKLINDGTKILQDLLIEKTKKVGNYLSTYALYHMYFKIQKLIYLNLNKCKDYSNFLEAEVWIPKIYYNKLISEMESILNEKENFLLPKFDDFRNENRFKKYYRTYFRVNDFTYAFQEIVNTYGTPRYKEANPGFFTIITFPFLFGIMFGDIGHGFLLLLFSLYICFYFNEINNNKNSMLKDLLPFRYILLLMGFFSMFCGFMYNDFMGIPLTIFNSCYINNGLIANKKQNCVYKFGIDPKWYFSKNELTFFNSLKMKLSVIVGVSQMTLGIILRGCNNLYFNDIIGFIFEFIPQILFMLLLFGYMILLIFIKWSTDYSFDTSKAPSIITILMNLALKNGSVEQKPVWGNVLIEEKTNKILFIISICCIPIILFPKPIFKIIEMNKKNEQNENDELKEFLINENYDDDEEDYKKIEKEIPETATDIFVHQIIETIEFVLGCVSNTASYLRLWALSLAHSQLGEVFFEKCILILAENGNFIGVIIGYFLFANITVSVLMGMDLLEAFLHTLRLHWVEFQNKFYYADGILFQPFSFKKLIDEIKDDDK